MQKESAQWYVLQNQRRLGPIKKRDVLHLLVKEKLQASSYVYRPGFANWKRLGEVPEFTHFLRGRMPLDTLSSQADEGQGRLLFQKQELTPSEKQSVIEKYQDFSSDFEKFDDIGPQSTPVFAFSNSAAQDLPSSKIDRADEVLKQNSWNHSPHVMAETSDDARASEFENSFAKISEHADFQESHSDVELKDPLSKDCDPNAEKDLVDLFQSTKLKFGSASTAGSQSANILVAENRDLLQVKELLENEKNAGASKGEVRPERSLGKTRSLLLTSFIYPILQLGFYVIYWGVSVCDELSTYFKASPQSFNSVLLSIALFIPGPHLWAAYTLASKVESLQRRSNLESLRPGWCLCLWLIPLFPFAYMYVMQKALNECWMKLGKAK